MATSPGWRATGSRPPRRRRPPHRRRPPTRIATARTSRFTQPIKRLYQAVNAKNLELYAAQWSNDARYVDATTGVTHTKAEKIEERRASFAAWELVSLIIDRAAVVDRGPNHATVKILYSMTVKPYGRPSRSQTGVAEQYDLVCDGDRRWLIQANIDENR